MLKINGKTCLTIEQQKQVIKNYLLIPVKTLSVKVGRSETVLRRFLKKNNLIIPPEIIERNRKSSQIKPGNIPPNKGKKMTDYMSAEAIAKTAATRFKKGTIPPNTYENDGVITIRKDKRTGRAYKYIRLSKGKWREYHLHLWEQQNGPLPKGHCLWFRDRDTMNVDLANLELITRKDNRLRNTGWNNLNDQFIASTIAWRDKEAQADIMNHPELIDLKRKEILLSRAIKQQQNGKSNRTI